MNISTNMHRQWLGGRRVHGRYGGVPLPLFVLILVFVVACGDAPEPSPTPIPTLESTPTPVATVTPTTTATPAAATPLPEVERVLRIAEAGGWRQLDPYQTTSPTFFHFFGNVYSGLVRWETGPDVMPGVRRVVPDLAASWEQRDDRSYLFHLRPEARWQDVPPVNGRRVTAQDVEFSLRRLRASAHQSLWSRVASVRAVNDTDVLIVLTEPYPPFLSQLASGVNVIVAPEAVEGSERGDLYEGPVVGTGPFIFDSQLSHRETRGIFHRNPSFYEEGRPKLDRIERLVAGSQYVGLVMLRTGAVDVLDMDPPVAQEFIDRPITGLNLLPQQGQTGWALTFKMQPPFDQVDARHAASLALDRDTLWRAYSETGTQFIVGLGMPVPTASAFLPATEINDAYRWDVNAARRLLSSLDVTAFTLFSVTVPNFGEGSVLAGNQIVDNLRSVGFAVELRIVDPGVYAATVQVPPGIFDVAFGPVVAPIEADLWLQGRFGDGGVYNVLDRTDEDLDALLFAQRTETDPARRASLLVDVQRLLLDRAYQPMVFLDQTWVAVRSEVDGWSSSLDEPFQRFLRDVSVPAVVREEATPR